MPPPKTSQSCRVKHQASSSMIPLLALFCFFFNVPLSCSAEFDASVGLSHVHILVPYMVQLQWPVETSWRSMFRVTRWSYHAPLGSLIKHYLYQLQENWSVTFFVCLLFCCKKCYYWYFNYHYFRKYGSAESNDKKMNLYFLPGGKSLTWPHWVCLPSHDPLCLNCFCTMKPFLQAATGALLIARKCHCLSQYLHLHDKQRNNLDELD